MNRLTLGGIVAVTVLLFAAASLFMWKKERDAREQSVLEWSPAKSPFYDVRLSEDVAFTEPVEYREIISNIAVTTSLRDAETVTGEIGPDILDLAFEDEKIALNVMGDTETIGGKGSAGWKGILEVLRSREERAAEVRFSWFGRSEYGIIESPGFVLLFTHDPKMDNFTGMMMNKSSNKLAHIDGWRKDESMPWEQICEFIFRNFQLK